MQPSDLEQKEHEQQHEHEQFQGYQLQAYRDTSSSHSNKDQNGVLSLRKYKSRGLLPNETRTARKAQPENSYEGRPRDRRHRQTRRVDYAKASGYSSLHLRKLSNFNDAPINKSMDQSEEHKGIVGLANIGNTCYMNSVIQALRNSADLTSFFFEGRQDEFFKNKDQAKPSIVMTKSYVDLIKMLWAGKKPSFVRPEGFFQDMSRCVRNTGFDQFQLRMAHDSHEFLMFLLDSFHESIAEEVNITILRDPPKNESEETVQKALEAWKQQFQKSYSPLIDILFGLYHREMCCQGCQKKSSSWEMFNCLKVAPPKHGEPPPSIKELLLKEMEEETITEYACDHCKPLRTTAIRKTKLWKLPRCLFVVVKRFTPDGRKAHGPVAVNYNDELNFQEFFSEHSPEPSREKNYRLYATVDHHGSAGGGHYTAQAESPLTQKWYGYNDDSTHPLPHPSIGSSTYILFYRTV